MLEDGLLIIQDVANLDSVLNDVVGIEIFRLGQWTSLSASSRLSGIAEQIRWMPL